MAIGAEHALAWNVLVFVVLPLWLAAGFSDYLCHRAAHIGRANGARESLLHWLMLAEIGLPLLATDIAAGRLVTPLPDIQVPRTGYVALVPFDADKTAPLTDFVDWMVAEGGR